jgi:hypothetical protein
MDCGTLVFGFVGIALAIGVPLLIEERRRPRLRIDVAADANRIEPTKFRIVHVAVRNEPIEGILAKWLLRNPASGCRVEVSIRSESDDLEVQFAGKWSATPEPISYAVGDSLTEYADPQKIPAMLSLDVLASRKGEWVAIAIKHDGEGEAYGYGTDLYFNPESKPLRNAGLALPDTSYLVTVTASAGEISKTAQFRLRNDGDRYTGLSLEPL